MTALVFLHPGNQVAIRRSERGHHHVAGDASRVQALVTLQAFPVLPKHGSLAVMLIDRVEHRSLNRIDFAELDHVAGRNPRHVDVVREIHGPWRLWADQINLRTGLGKDQRLRRYRHVQGPQQGREIALRTFILQPRVSVSLQRAQRGDRPCLSAQRRAAEILHQAVAR